MKLLFSIAAHQRETTIYQKSKHSRIIARKTEFADIPLAGDIGYTTVPFEFRKDRTSKKADGYEHYMSIQKKEKDSTWRVVVDTGIFHLKLDSAITEFILPRKIRRSTARFRRRLDTQTEREHLLEKDHEFSSFSVS